MESSKPQSRYLGAANMMTPCRGNLKQSLSRNGINSPRVAPLSDSSASSSSSCEAVGCPPSQPMSQPLHFPLEIEGGGFVPVNPHNKQQTQNKQQKHVQFRDVEIRKYPIILGDHPECSMGPPVSSIFLTSSLIDHWERMNITNSFLTRSFFAAYNRLGTVQS
jgi:hypothetical protein